MEYYNVHCAHCGKTIQADRMAVNVDGLIQIFLSKTVSRSDMKYYKEGAELFGEIRTGIYLTSYEMVDWGLLNQDDWLHMTGQDVLNYIERKYQIMIPKREEEENKQPDWMLDMKKFMEEAEKETEENSMLDELCRKLFFYKERDIDTGMRKEYVGRFISFLQKYSESVLLKCYCEFLQKTDDHGKQFTSALRVTFEDGDTHSFGHMVCPYCGESFFTDAGRFQEHVIVMLGSSRVGKTAYLAALVDKINPQYGQSEYSDIILKDVMDKNFQHFKENILKPYQEGRKIEKTDEQKDEVALFSLEITIAQKTAIFTFVDLPGEVFVPRSDEEQKEGTASGSFIWNYRRICYEADAFWLCIAPVQLDARLCSMNEVLEKADRIEQDLGMILSNIENTLQLMGGDKMQTPIAVLVTMSDLIPVQEELYTRSDDTEKKCLQNGMQVRANVMQAYSNRVRSYLTSNHVKNIVPKLKTMFRYQNYFAVAAYGRTVGEKEDSREKMPYGIMMPFLWTSAVLGYLTILRPEVKMERKGLFGTKQEHIYYCVAEPEELYAD